MKQTKTLWMALVALLAIGFSSCNDEIADYKTELKTFRETLVDNTADLQEKLDDMKAALDTADINHATYQYVDSVDQVLQDQLNDLKSHLANHCDSIKTLYNRMTAVENAVIDAAAAAAAAQQTANQAVLDAANAQTSADNAQNTADQAQSDATQAITDAANAQSTANTARDLAIANSTAIVALTTWQTATEIWKGKVNDSLASLRYDISYAIALAKMDSTNIEALKLRDDALSDSIQQLYDTLSQYVTRPEMIDSLNKYLGYANHYSDSLHTIAMDSIGALANQVDINRDSIAIINAAYQHADSLLQDSIDALAVRVDLILAQVLENTRRIDSICLELDTIKNRLDAIENHLDRAIYSLAAQGTVNTVFGYAALPGYALNILIGYYGQASDQGVKFPTYRTANLVPAAATLTQAEATAAGLALEGFTAAGQEVLVAEGSNAGKLYFQLNPAQANLDATNFQLVKSNGNACAINIDSVKASEDELTFGVSFNGRSNAAALTGAQSANGFYEMYTSIDESNINALKITIDENLKSTAKNMLDKGIRNISGADLTALAKAMYDQMNGFLPAYALQATWTDSLGEHTVNSDYNIAATAVKPLSFNFLSGVNFPKIRKITPLDELNFSIGNINIDMSSISFGINPIDLDLQVSFEVKFDTINIDDLGDFTVSVAIPDSFKLVSADYNGSAPIPSPSVHVTTGKIVLPNGTVIGAYNDITGEVTGDVVWTDAGGNPIDSLAYPTPNVTVTFTNPTLDVNGQVQNGIIVATHYKDTTVNMGDYKEFMEKFITNINTAMTKDAANINNGVKNQLIGEIKDQVNDKFNNMITDINNSVNNMISNIAADLNANVNAEIQKVVNNINSKLGGYLDKANALIKRMNNIIDKINNRLTSPNQFLQPVLLYNGADGGVHFLSQSKSIPSVFRGNGAITLYPTSYTAEIVAPAYKKFVAVVDVYTATASAQDGDAACLAALNATNSGEYFNTVLDGGRYGIVGTFQAGYTYKILYSAVDYHGKIAQNFYYVTVK